MDFIFTLIVFLTYCWCMEFPQNWVGCHITCSGTFLNARYWILNELLGKVKSEMGKGIFITVLLKLMTAQTLMITLQVSEAF